ncbi:hypothetical protein LTR66_005324 [Elasticomyces elasticus]|nr:hypothetical protein LTR66_005324 [Elasticomyces elasticus]
MAAAIERTAAILHPKPDKGNDETELLCSYVHHNMTFMTSAFNHMMVKTQQRCSKKITKDQASQWNV